MSPAHASASLDLALSPGGRLRLAASDTAIGIEPTRLARLTQAFERGSGDGLVQLGGAELDGDLPPALLATLTDREGGTGDVRRHAARR